LMSDSSSLYLHYIKVKTSFNHFHQLAFIENFVNSDRQQCSKTLLIFDTKLVTEEGFFFFFFPLYPVQI